MELERFYVDMLQMYWEKRLERAPKNILDDSLFREETKKTSPPPSRKGGGEQYKPTTTRPLNLQYNTKTKTKLLETGRKIKRIHSERQQRRLSSVNTRLKNTLTLADNKCKTLRKHTRLDY